MYAAAEADHAIDANDSYGRQLTTHVWGQTGDTSCLKHVSQPSVYYIIYKYTIIGYRHAYMYIDMQM